MRDYGKVYSRFWQNPDVKSWGGDEALLALYLLTSPHSNLIGCYYLPIGYAAEDLQQKMPYERLSEAFDKLSVSQFAAYDKPTRWVWIRGFLKFNNFENPNVGVSAAKVLLKVPRVLPFFDQLVKSIIELGAWGLAGPPKILDEIRKPCESLAKGAATPSLILEPEPEPKKKELSGPSPPPLKSNDFSKDAIQAWNAMADRCHLPVVQRLTGNRKRLLLARLDENGIDAVLAAIGKVEKSSFLTGKVAYTNGHENWRCNFDFILKAEKFTKLMEGAYDDRANGKAGRGVSERIAPTGPPPKVGKREVGSKNIQ